MKHFTVVVLLAGVFLTATLVTAFALTLAAAPAVASSSVLARFGYNATHYGWAAGVSVTVVFLLPLKRFINRSRSEKSKSV